LSGVVTGFASFIPKQVSSFSMSGGFWSTDWGGHVRFHI
jgi:hypothetical protein